MFGWVFTFFVLTVVAAFMGFVSMTGFAALFVKLLFVLFAILCTTSGIVGLLQGEPPT